MGDKKICYKWVNFFAPDYQALEMYLNQLAYEGYMLIKINFIGIGTFEKRENRDIRYRVVIEKKKSKGMEYWELIAKLDQMFIFRTKVDVSPNHEEVREDKKLEREVHQDIEEQPLTMRWCLKIQRWSIVMGIVWMIYGVGHMCTLREWDLLSNASLIIPVLISLLGIMVSCYNVYFLYTSYMRKSKITPTSILAARWRSRAYMGVLIVVTIMMLVVLLKELSGIEKYILPYLIILFFSAKIYSQPRRWVQKIAMGIVLFMTPILLGFFMINSSMSTLGSTSAEDHRKTQQWIDSANILNIGSFVEQNHQLEHQVLEEAESLLIKRYYEYKGYAGSGEHLSYDYYEAQNIWATNQMMEILIERYIDDEWKTQMGSIQSETEQIYVNNTGSRLLLRKDNEIYFLSTRYINLDSQAPIDIIKNFTTK